MNAVNTKNVNIILDMASDAVQFIDFRYLIETIELSDADVAAKVAESLRVVAALVTMGDEDGRLRRGN